MPMAGGASTSLLSLHVPFPAFQAGPLHWARTFVRQHTSAAPAGACLCVVHARYMHSFKSQSFWKVPCISSRLRFLFLFHQCLHSTVRWLPASVGGILCRGTVCAWESFPRVHSISCSHGICVGHPLIAFCSFQCGSCTN